MIYSCWLDWVDSTTIYGWDTGSSPNWAGVRAELCKYFIFTFPAGGWLGVEIEVNANTAPNWVGVGAGAEQGNIFVLRNLLEFPLSKLKQMITFFKEKNFVDAIFEQPLIVSWPPKHVNGW